MRKNYSDAFKRTTVRQMLNGVSAEELSKEHKVNQSVLYSWKRKLGKKLGSAKAEAKDPGSKAEGRFDLYVKGERAQLLQVIGELTIELRKLKGKA